MRALKEAVAFLTALLTTLEPAKSEDATKYMLAHVEATSWSASQIIVYNDQM